MDLEPDELIDYLSADAQRDAPAALACLTDALQERFGPALSAILFYGSCMRTGDYRDAVVDLHVIIDDYAAYDSRLLALLNRVLAPNVFYLAVNHEGEEIRAKYNVFARRHLARLVSPGRLAVFSWARLAQRSAVLYARDARAEAEVQALRARAVRTFATAAAPLCGDPSAGPDFWVQALKLTFGAELRAESTDRAQLVVDQDADYFREISRHLAMPAAGEGRRRARLLWWLRAAVGKTGSVLRLCKGWYTFSGGLEYLVWKLERHAGRPIELPERVRQRPLLHIWGFAWRLYREGVFR